MTDYAEREGIWHVVDHQDGAEVVTFCERRIEAPIQPLAFEPKPLCYRCRERRGPL